MLFAIVYGIIPNAELTYAKKVNAMDQNISKIKVKLGENELELEGPVALINEQYKAFLDAIKASASQRAEVVIPSSGESTAIPQQPPETVPIRETLKRIYAERDAVISLLALPKTETSEADALLLLLYGYEVLRPSDYPVTGVRLMQAAKQSGLHAVDRIDRTIMTHSKYILAAGTRRGRKYQLNNQGISKAQEIIQAILK